MTKSRADKFRNALAALCDLAELSEPTTAKILIEQIDEFDPNAIETLIELRRRKK